MSRRTSRRALFGSAAVLAALPVFVRVGGPDRELIALCGAFIAECDRFDEVCEAAGTDDALRNREALLNHAVSDAQIDQMERLRATTPEGIQARALALHRLNGRGEFSYERDEDTPSRMLAYLLRDAAALGGAA